MDIPLKIDLPVYATLISLILILYISRNSEKKDYSSKLFLQVLWITLAMSLIDAVAWIPNGIDTAWAKNLHIVSNIIYFALCTLPPMVWVRYLDFKIANDIEGMKKRTKFYSIPTLIGWTLIPVNAFTGIIYYYSETNQYFRGPVNSIYLIMNLALFFIGLIFAMRLRKRITGKLTQFLIIFILLPIIGAVTQQLFYGLSLTCPMLNLAILLAFIFLEKDTMLKDSLTSIYTRSIFESRLKYKLKRFEPFSIMLFDLNDFKQINDNYGHNVGDEALITFSSILQSNIKKEDMVCRYGGDEFTIIIESIAPEAGNKIFGRIEKAIDEYNNKRISPYKISTSCGISFVNTPISMEELLLSVDRKMYANKAQKKESQN